MTQEAPGSGSPTPGLPDCADFAQSGMATIPCWIVGVIAAMFVVSRQAF
jgi:hypothetical protein